MVEVVLVFPDGVVGKSRVIVSILGSLHGVDIKENIDSVLGASIEEPGDLVSGSISATNIWSIRLESPVSNWETDDLNLSLSEVSDKVFGDPGVPMCSKNSVTLLWSEGLTE
jgi:hypothetical protein